MNEQVTQFVKEIGKVDKGAADWLQEKIDTLWNNPEAEDSELTKHRFEDGLPFSDWFLWDQSPQGAEFWGTTVVKVIPKLAIKKLENCEGVEEFNFLITVITTFDSRLSFFLLDCAYFDAYDFKLTGDFMEVIDHDKKGVPEEVVASISTEIDRIRQDFYAFKSGLSEQVTLH